MSIARTVDTDSQPTGVGELNPARIVSPVPERYRVSVVGGHTQVDISLPADALVAEVLPYLSGLITQRENGGQDPATLRGETTQRRVLTRNRRDGDPLSPEQSLRTGGVRSGDMLYLRTERTLRPPTLYDDVVDAAAQLNRAAYAAWGPASAAVMACVALYAGVAILVWMSVDERFSADRTAIVGIEVAAAAALWSAAAVAHRFHGADRAAAMFGWAAMPLAAAAVWTPLTAWGRWGPAAACGLVIVLNYLAYRLIGAAVGGFLAGGLIAVAGAVMFVAQAGPGYDAKPVGAVVGTGLLLACRLVPGLRTGPRHLGGGARAPARSSPDDRYADPFGYDGDQVPADPGDALPTAEAVLARARAATTVRCALYAAVSAAVVLCVVMVLQPWSQPRWVDLAFAMVCAVALGLRVRACPTAVERAAPILGAAVVTLLACAAAVAGPPAFAVAGAVTLALGMVGAAAVVVGRPARGRRRALDTFLDYADYLAAGALTPLALAVIGLYAHLGGGWL